LRASVTSAAAPEAFLAHRGAHFARADEFSAVALSIPEDVKPEVRPLEVEMGLSEVVSRDEWLIARKELLTREKELNRQRDALNADRRRLPMVLIDTEYVFEGQPLKAAFAEVRERSLVAMVVKRWLSSESLRPSRRLPYSRPEGH
jgi:hypothetical protein